MKHKVFVTPKGRRWPWYPAYRGEAVIQTGSDENGNPTADFVFAKPLAKGAVGMRVWLTMLWRGTVRWLQP